MTEMKDGLPVINIEDVEIGEMIPVTDQEQQPLPIKQRLDLIAQGQAGLDMTVLRDHLGEMQLQTILAKSQHRAADGTGRQVDDYAETLEAKNKVLEAENETLKHEVEQKREEVARTDPNYLDPKFCPDRLLGRA